MKFMLVSPFWTFPVYVQIYSFFLLFLVRENITYNHVYKYYLKKNTNIFFVNNMIKNNYFINEKYNYIIGTRLHVLFFLLQ